METTLIESLHRKLGDLDHKVRAYRHDLVTDFERYYHEQLQDVNPTTAFNVGRAIALSMSNYQALRPELDEFIRRQPAESRDPSNNPGSASFQPSPPSSVFGAAEASNDLHEREQELQGLFTPSYLPLLDSLPVVRSNSNSSKPPSAAAYAPFAAPPFGVPPLLPGPKPDEPSLVGAGQQGADMNRQPGTDDVQGSGGSGGGEGFQERPQHVRRLTDDTTSSIVSDKSDTKPRRRSALRQSSSPAKIPVSPRRVRFEFEGAEVLPTSSPEPSESGFAPPSSAQPEDEQLVARSILDDEDEHERLPPPRKISSSEALRALSRTPLEDGTVWTVVDPNSDKSSQAKEDIPMPISTQPIADKAELSAPRDERSSSTSAPVPSETLRTKALLSSVHEEPEQEHDSENDSSDEEFLAMAKTRKPIGSPAAIKKSTTRPAPSLSPRLADNAYGRGSQETKTHSPGADDIDGDDEDELFQFEPTGGLSAPPRPRPITPPTQEEVVEDETETSSDALPSANAESTAVPIAKPASPGGPSTPTTSRFQAECIGSYKGRPVIMPVVRNPEVHAQAASLGEFNTFVGGLDGRSGMDEGDLNSFRASLVPSGFSGTPRSLTERLMLEEAMERRQNQARPH